MWAIVKIKYSENIILLQNREHLIIAKVRKICNNNVVNFWKSKYEIINFSQINNFSVKHGEISETIFTFHFYRISLHKLVVTLKTMSLLNKIRRLDYEAVQSESKAIIWSQSSHFVTF